MSEREMRAARETQGVTEGVTEGGLSAALLEVSAEMARWRAAGWSLELSAPPTPDPHALPVLTLCLSRPHAYNALSLEAIASLVELTAWLTQQDALGHLGALVLTGGEGRFIAGGDLKDLHSLTAPEQASQLSIDLQGALARLSDLRCPTLCAIEGFAIGGGAEVALAADLCVMANDAYLRFAQRSLGLCTAWGGAHHLTQALSPRLAFALLAREAPIYAAEAAQLGLAHRLTEPGEALSEALAWAHSLASTPHASAALKALTLRPSAHTTSQREQVLLRERELFEGLWTSPQHWARVDAFWEAQRRKRAQRALKTQGREAQTDTAQAGGAQTSEALKAQGREAQAEATHEGGAQTSEALKAHAHSAQKTTQKGLFIVFEGIDGAGTTTQAHALVKALQASGERAHFTNEPSEGVLGTLTRRALRGEALGREGAQLPSESIALLFAADRADHWHNEIKPRLARGEHVVCDRYLYSSLAYQSLEHPEAWVRELNAPFPAPDLLIYVQASAELGAQRRAARGLEPDRYEVNELQVKIAAAYDRLCAEAGALTLDASLSVEALSERCYEATRALLNTSPLVDEKAQR